MVLIHALSKGTLFILTCKIYYSTMHDAGWKINCHEKRQGLVLRARFGFKFFQFLVFAYFVPDVAFSLESRQCQNISFDSTKTDFIPVNRREQMKLEAFCCIFIYTFSTFNSMAEIMLQRSKLPQSYYKHTCMQLSHVMRNLVFGVSVQVQNKPDFTATEDG